MTNHPRHAFAIFALTVALFLAGVGSPGSLARLDVAAAAGPVTSATHPYGDPVWLPLRKPADIGNAHAGHGYWALDFVGRRGDPIHAAGAGIAHIGGNEGGCSSTKSDVEGGRWVWIDHGGGVVTRYHHLDSIAITEGQLVTPATRIGGMGNTGDIYPCTAMYLHFEVRHGGLKGSRVDPGQLRACVEGEATAAPAALGFSSWNASGLHPSPRLKTPSADSSCVTSDWLGSPAEPTLTVAAGNRTAQFSWAAAPAGTNSVTVLFETYHPSIKQWGHPVYRVLDGSTTGTAFDNLENGRTYRARLSLHNRAGTSTWSDIVKVIPATVPGAPRSPRYLTWPRRTYVHYGWYRPAANGRVVTSFISARRCRTTNGVYGAWKSYEQGPTDTYRNFRGVESYRYCQVKVRGVNAIGAGPWSITSTIKR